MMDEIMDRPRLPTIYGAKNAEYTHYENQNSLIKKNELSMCEKSQGFVIGLFQNR
jgi:hypothetical protein